MRGGRWVEKNASEARGGRRCARLRRAEGAERERRGARAAARDSIADGTALQNIVGEEVAATLRTSEIRLGVLSLYSMSGDASGKPTPSYKEILQSKDKAVSEANTLLKGKEKIVKPSVSEANSLLKSFERSEIRNRSRSARYKRKN